MESHPYTKPRGVGPVTTQLTPGAEPASWEVRRRTRPMVLLANLQSVEQILYAIFYRFNQHGCGLYLQPAQYRYGLYLQPELLGHTLRLFSPAA